MVSGMKLIGITVEKEAIESSSRHWGNVVRVREGF